MQEARGTGCKRTTGGIFALMVLLCVLTVSLSVCWLWFCTISFQDVTLGRNWVNNTQDLSVLFLTTWIHNYLKRKNLTKIIKHKPHPFVISQVRSSSTAQLDVLLRSHQAEPKVPAGAVVSSEVSLSSSQFHQELAELVPCDSKMALPFPGLTRDHSQLSRAFLLLLAM